MENYKIAHLYYDLMNLYGENGNIRFLKDKLEKQNINVEVHFLSLKEEIDFEKYDFYYIGTGNEENKYIVLKDILKYKEDIKKAIDNHKFFLVTGNSLDLFCNSITNEEEKVDSLGVFPYDVIEEDFRIVGDVYARCSLLPKNIIGFQNRNSIIKEPSNRLFDIISGTGCNPNEAVEGIHSKNFYGTYLLGPLLVRNPYFTDFLVKEICKSKDIKYKEPDLTHVSYIAYEEYIKNFFENQ